MERTFVAIKPDAVQRGLVGEIISRFEKKGFKIVGLKIIQPSKDLATRHYEEHIGKPFFENLVRFITSSPVVAMVIEGKNAVDLSRKIMGATNPIDADCGSIRADYAHTMERNIIHGSDSVESAKREIANWFTEDEITSSWSREIDRWFIQ